MTVRGARTVALNYRPRVLAQEQERAHAQARAQLADLDGQRRAWEGRILAGLCYFGLGGQPESGPARHARTHAPDTYARHLRIFFALVDRWFAACETLATAGYPHTIDPPDLPVLLAPYIGD